MARFIPDAEWFAHHRSWLAVLPAVATTITLGIVIGRALLRPQQVLDRYRIQARTAMAEDRLDDAAFFYSRLVGAGDEGSAADQFNWITILRRQAKSTEAEARLEALAPVGKIGHPPAHLQRALRLIREATSRPLSEAQLRALNWHLQRGAQTPSSDNDLLWARYHMMVGDRDAAETRLRSAAAQKPDLWVRVADQLRSWGRRESADLAQSAAQDHLRSAIEKDPIDVDRRIALASLLVQQKKVAAAREVLQDGRRLLPNDAKLRRAQSNLALVVFDEVAKDGEVNVEERLTRLIEAARIDPLNPTVYSAISALQAGVQDPSVRMRIRDLLEGWIAEGERPAVAHFALGNLLFNDDDIDAAVFHFETALDQEPSLAAVANNLAWAIAHQDPPSWQRAEELIDTALARNPNRPSFLDTKAWIVARQSRFREAIAIIEKILPSAEGRKAAQLHARLADLYDQVGQSRLASRHRAKQTEWNTEHPDDPVQSDVLPNDGPVDAPESQSASVSKKTTARSRIHRAANPAGPTRFVSPRRGADANRTVAVHG